VLSTQPESVGRWKSLSFRKRVVVAVTTAVVVAMIIAGILVGVWFFLDNTVKIVQV